MRRERRLSEPFGEPAGGPCGDLQIKAHHQRPEEKLSEIEERAAFDELYLADEVFLSGTAAELVPVREVDDHTIGTGKPGEITRVLQTAFDDAVHGRTERYREWLDLVPVLAEDAPEAGATESLAEGQRTPAG